MSQLIEMRLGISERRFASLNKFQCVEAQWLLVRLEV
jgi:hypothetical protein